jgi:hypothetical protein
VSRERRQSFRSAKKPLSLLLGFLMLTFGLLKVVNPTIDGWFTVQIQQSHLPHSAIPIGKIGDHDGTSVRASAVSSVARALGGSHFIDRLLKPPP